jgi:peroxiredoxin
MSKSSVGLPYSTHNRSRVVSVLLLMTWGMLIGACASSTSTPGPVASTSSVDVSTPVPTPTPISIEAEHSPADVPVRPQKGFRAPDFTLSDLDGEQVSLSDFQGQLVLINFWAAWCPPCRDELPAIHAQYEESDDLVVLGVNFQEGADEVGPFVTDEGLTFPILLDKEGRVTMMYRARGLPTSFLVDAEGIITAVHIGPMTAHQLKGHVTQARGE